MKRGKKKLLTVLIIALIIGCIYYSKGDGSHKVSTGEQGLSVEERLPNIPEYLRDHYWLNKRMKGTCRSLQGNVVATVIYYSDDNAAWTEERIAAQTQMIENEMAFAVQEAQKYGTELCFSANYMRAGGAPRIQKSSSDDERKVWYTELFKNLGFGESIDTVNEYLKSRYNADAAPVLILYAGDGRSYSTIIANQIEVSIVYENNINAFTHELCHMFGAVDFYRPDWVSDKFKQYYSESLMYSTSSGVFDSLTVYLIGWTDELAPEATQLLIDTQGVNADSYPKEAGYSVGKKTYDNGAVYEVELYDGVAHGKGTLYYSNGTVYEGDFVHGKLTGYGTYYFSNGASYKGQVVDSELTGYGTYYFVDGASYKGQIVNGKLTGYGTFYYVNGDVYEGYFTDGKRNGYGILRLNTGKVLEGNWQNGKFLG